MTTADPTRATHRAVEAVWRIEAARLIAALTRMVRDVGLAEGDRLLIGRGLAALDLAVALGGGEGRYALQAAIAACHPRTSTAEATDSARIASLYGVLSRVAPPPVIELNRAVAVSMADGPAAGLELVDALIDDNTLARYHLLPAVRADLLVKLSRPVEARIEFECGQRQRLASSQFTSARSSASLEDDA